MIEAAGLDLDDDFVSSGDGIGDFTQFEFSGRAVSE